jgi:tRNA(His) 5'-end guanylyltransferase
MRQYERSQHHKFPEGFLVVVHLDGKGFSSFTEKNFEKPFDERFHLLMVDTLSYITESGGIKCHLGYTQSDEISLFLDPYDSTDGRREQKWYARFASTASSRFTNQSGFPVEFDCKFYVYPNLSLLVDHFRWRQSDGTRNALTGWCYWSLRKSGKTARQSNSVLKKKGHAFKQEMLFTEFGINFNDLPGWQKRGTAVYWETFNKIGVDPRNGNETFSQRRRLVVDQDLPIGDAYATYLEKRLSQVI